MFLIGSEPCFPFPTFFSSDNKIIIEVNIFFPNRRLTCFENKFKKKYTVQATINVTKRGNLSVEFLCSTLDLRCAVKNV